MLTYVINTSDNKNFDSNLLFDLSGYNKIRWMHASLHEVEKCADEIGAKQGALGADRFRIAVIVDFYTFDKVRVPYGRYGFDRDGGVDLSIYVPYIEVFLLDNLIAKLAQKELYAADFEVYYVQNEKSERYELFENAETQLSQVMQGIDPDNGYDIAAALQVGDCTRCADAAALAEQTEGEPSTPKKSKKTKNSEDGTEENRENQEAKKARGCAYCPGKQHLVNRVHLAHFCADEVQPDTDAFPKLPKNLADLPREGTLLPFIRDSKIQIGDEVRVVSDDRPDQTFVVKELYRQDGIDVKTVDSATDKFFLLVPQGITVGGNDVLVKCDKMYRSFKLHCTPTVSLHFDLVDYPYGATAMTFSQFWAAFQQRWSIKTDIRRHYYLTAYGGGVSRAALDMLSLSLYLIRMYEREEDVVGEGDMELLRLDAGVLKEVLETAWSKVNAAKAVAKKNNIQYYALDQIQFATEEEIAPPIPAEQAIAHERAALPKGTVPAKMSVEEMHRKIEEYATRTPGELSRKNREEFNGIMSEYLVKRDETRESDVREEFQSMKAAGFLKTTDQCPSREDYEFYVTRKEEEISRIFEKALAAEYINVQYDEEKTKADEALVRYQNAQACMKRSLIGDILFLILAVGSMFLPYYLLQLRSYTVGAISATMLGLITAGAFGGLFVLSVILQLIPQASRLRRAKRDMQNCYLDCCAKERYSFSALRRRYQNDLIAIEHARYEIRQLKRLYDANLEKDKNVTMHHEMLEKLEDCLGSILNNLDVEPVAEEVDALDDEFDLSKPFRARENRVYQIFSIETIERMFPKKGDETR